MIERRIMETKIEQARELLRALESKRGGFAEGIEFFRIQESLVNVKRQMKISC